MGENLPKSLKKYRILLDETVTDSYGDLNKKIPIK
jgi:hypothetical protein